MSVFYVYDAAGQGISDDEAILNCLRKRKETDGSAAIVFDRKDYLIQDAVLLPSDTTVIIDGCMIKQRDNVFDNVFRGDNYTIDPQNPYGDVLAAEPLHNIRVLGKNGAKIQGPDVNRIGYYPFTDEYQTMTGDFWGWRTLQICLSGCDGFEISGIEFTKTRCWCMSFDFCQNGYIHDVTVISDVKNGDGIDFRSGCHDCVVENISGFTSDDTVACTALMYADSVKAYPSGKYLYPLSPMNGFSNRHNCDIYNIKISNITTGGHHHGVIVLASNGNQVHHIEIQHIYDGEQGDREATVKVYTGYGDRPFTDGDIHHIVVKDVKSTISKYDILCTLKPFEFDFQP